MKLETKFEKRRKVFYLENGKIEEDRIIGERMDYIYTRALDEKAEAHYPGEVRHVVLIYTHHPKELRYKEVDMENVYLTYEEAWVALKLQTDQIMMSELENHKKREQWKKEHTEKLNSKIDNYLGPICEVTVTPCSE